MGNERQQIRPGKASLSTRTGAGSRNGGRLKYAVTRVVMKIVFNFMAFVILLSTRSVASLKYGDVSL